MQTDFDDLAEILKEDNIFVMYFDTSLGVGNYKLDLI